MLSLFRKKKIPFWKEIGLKSTLLVINCKPFFPSLAFNFSCISWFLEGGSLKLCNTRQKNFSYWIKDSSVTFVHIPPPTNVSHYVALAKLSFFAHYGKIIFPLIFFSHPTLIFLSFFRRFRLKQKKHGKYLLVPIISNLREFIHALCVGVENYSGKQQKAPTTTTAMGRKK